MDNKEYKKLLKELNVLIEGNKLKEAKTLYQCNAEDIKRYMKGKEYISIKGHLYSGFNLFILSLFEKPGTFGTFKQWIQEKRKVKKGEHGIKISVPIFEDKEKTKIRFVKQVSIFSRNQTEAITV